MPVPPRRLTVVCAIAVTLVAAGLRATRLTQSLSADEMATLVHYARQPWAVTLAGGPGQYGPANHVLHTVLAKLANRAFGTPDGPPREWALRLPSWIAGSLLPVALAWPLRRRTPLLAIAVAAVAAVHPWLLAVSAEADGYAVALLLGVVATNAIPTTAPAGRRVAVYAVALAAAIYAVPVAALLIPAHAAAVLARRTAFRPWLAGVTLAAVIAVAAYAPMRAGLVSYYQDAPGGTTWPRFAAALPGHAVAGRPLPTAGSAAIAAVILAGTVVGFRLVADARPLLVTLATVTAVGTAVAAAVPAAADVRLAAWAAPWFCLAVVLLFAGRPPVMAIATVALLVPLEWWDAHLPPDEPVREAMRDAAALIPADQPVVVLYAGADDAANCYGPLVETDGRWLMPVDDAAGWSEQTSGGEDPPWLVVLDEEGARDRSAADPWAAQVTRLLRDGYQLQARRPGRVAAVSIYRHKPPESDENS